MGKKNPDVPPPRDLYQESRDTLQAQVDLAPDLYEAESEYRPKYTELELQTVDQALRGSGDTPGLFELLGYAVPEMDRIEANSLESKRRSEVEQLQTLGADVVNAFDSIDPENARLKDMLTEQAISDLELGGELDQGTLRQVTQGARGQSALRGFGLDPQSFAQEVGAVGAAAENRKMQRRQFAQNVVSQNSATGLDPTMFLFNKPSNTASASGMLQGATGFQGGARLFSTNTPYAQDLFNTNYNAAAASDLAGANNQAMIHGQLIGSIGGIAAAGILACWVARSAYGMATNDWKEFRAWLLGKAPAWFRNLYLKHGERFAEWLDRHPYWKPVVRKIMDRLKG